MNIETNSSTPTIDEILSQVEQPPQAEPLAIDVRMVAEGEAKRAYHAARAEGRSIDHAKAAAEIAFSNVVQIELAKARARIAAEAARPKAPPLPPVPEPSDATKGGEMDEAGRQRSQRDVDALRAAGFAMAETVYERGTRVIELGTENAKRSREEFEAMPKVGELCSNLIAKIAAEKREVEIVRADAIGMTNTGRLSISGVEQWPITSDAFGSMVSRLGYGGARYLQKCDRELRAYNVNCWRREIARKQDADQTDEGDERKLALRTRLQGPEPRVRQVFAAVTPSYAPFDADRIAEAIRIATPPEARGTVTYDGARSRFNVLFETTVNPKHFVAGEVFRLGVTVRADDTGSGAIKMTAVALQNLCLNLIIIDRAMKPLAELRHVGNVFELATKFKAAYERALQGFEPFLAAWGYACEEDVAARSRAVTADIPRSITQALPGFFNGIIDAGLVELRGDRVKIVSALCEKWEADESGAKLNGLTRASIINAFTRFAHEEGSFDEPFAEDELQRQAAALLWGKRGQAPEPLPYEPLGADVEELVQAASAQGALS